MSDLKTIPNILAFIQVPKNIQEDLAASSTVDTIAALVRGNSEVASTFGNSPGFFHHFMTILRNHIGSGGGFYLPTPLQKNK